MRFPGAYWTACRALRDGRYQDAHRASETRRRSSRKGNSRLRTLIQNDLAVLDAVEGKFDEAREGWRLAIEGDGSCVAQLNLGLIEAELAWTGAATPETTEGGNAPDAGDATTISIAQLAQRWKHKIQR